jgi:hypothetical protein
VDKATEFLSVLINKKDTGLVTSINDLRDKELSGVKLNHEEKAALSNFDRYRMTILNSEENEEAFHYKYRQLQVIANLSDWHHFLKEDFF